MNLKQWINDWFEKGPYLKENGRLADLLAAIQVLGTYEFSARKLEKWENRLGRDPQSTLDWNSVFIAHPEFFTVDADENISLVWRRSFKRNFDSVTGEYVSKAERDRLKEEEKKPGAPPRLSREPLNQNQIEHLCNLAINLHEREIQHRQEKRWWVTALVAVIIAIIGIFN